jgi:hypothetical protein
MSQSLPGDTHQLMIQQSWNCGRAPVLVSQYCYEFTALGLGLRLLPMADGLMEMNLRLFQTISKKLWKYPNQQ